MDSRAGSMPVLIISAKGEQQTKVSALRGGADDFITKPFDIEEVSARIDSHLRRFMQIIPSASARILQYNGLVLDCDSKVVTAEGVEVALTAREYEILQLLLSEPRKVFTKANLYESVWGSPIMVTIIRLTSM